MMNKPKHYTALNPPPRKVIDDFGPSMTRQSERDSCDINKIMARYEKTGVLPVVNREAFYADVSQIGDYREACERIAMADEAFMELPAKVRAEFENDPAMFLDFCSDEANRDKMVEMGLIEDVSGEVPEVDNSSDVEATPVGDDGDE